MSSGFSVKLYWFVLLKFLLSPSLHRGWGQRSGSATDKSPWRRQTLSILHRDSVGHRVIKPVLPLTSTRPTNWIQETFYLYSVERLKDNTWNWTNVWNHRDINSIFASSSGCMKPKTSANQHTWIKRDKQKNQDDNITRTVFAKYKMWSTIKLYFSLFCLRSVKHIKRYL